MAIALEGMCPLLQVFDMPTSLAFYRDVLGFRVHQSSSEGDDCDWCWLVRDGSQLMLNTLYEREHRPPQPDPRRVKEHGDVALFFGCRDVDGAYQQLLAAGQQPGEPKTAPYGMRQLNLTDPDGYGICLQWTAG